MRYCKQSAVGACLCLLALPLNAATFGTQVSVSVLGPLDVDGGDGAISASLAGSTQDYSYMLDSDYSGPSYLPVLRAKSTSNGTIDDETTFANARAYQTFVSAIAQSITLDINLDAIVQSAGDSTSDRYTRALAVVSVWGGDNYEVSDSCSGQTLFDGLSICGTQYGFSWLEIRDSDNVTSRLDSITFNLEAGETFGIFASLNADSLNGSTNAYDTLNLLFDDDSNISVVNAPVPLPASIWLFITGAVSLLGMARARRRS
jgi:hypothetical protein